MTKLRVVLLCAVVLIATSLAQTNTQSTATDPTDAPAEAPAAPSEPSDSAAPGLAGPSEPGQPRVAPPVLPLEIRPDPAGASRMALLPCQVAPDVSGDTVHVGFPRTSHRPPTSGTATVAMIFVDFSDAPSTKTTAEVLAENWPQAETYLEDQSGGLLDINVDPLHTWLRMSETSLFYGLDDGASFAEHDAYLTEAINLADPTFDFTNVDIVVVISEQTAVEINGAAAFVMSNPAFGISVEGGSVTIMNAVHRGTQWFSSATPALDRSEMLIAHELLHNFGLTDLYNYYGVNFADQNVYTGNFDPMGSIVGFQGGVYPAVESTYNGQEMFAWHRWQLGWVNDAQIDCVTSYPHTTMLTDLSTPTGTKAAVVQTGVHQVIVAEARMQSRYDADIENEGVLVYSVDSSISSGSGPIRVEGPYAGDWADGSVLLQPGESMQLDGVFVGVVAATGGGYEILVGEPRCNGVFPDIDMNWVGGPAIGSAVGDVILGTPGADVIKGEGGDDWICGDDGDDIIRGGKGNDVIDAGRGDDIVRGGGGSDDIDGSAGNDELIGQAGSDTIRGRAGNDTIDGQGAPDTIFGGSGDDTINGQNGGDEMYGGPGIDVIRGQTGPDEFHGDADDDEMFGGDGADTLYGGTGFDRCSGNSGPDSAEAATCELTPGVESFF